MEQVGSPRPWLSRGHRNARHGNSQTGGPCKGTEVLHRQILHLDISIFLTWPERLTHGGAMMRGSGAPEQKWASHAGAVEIGAGGGHVFMWH